MTSGDSGPADVAPLNSSEGLLWRQVHRTQFKQGQPTSVNFRPAPRDAGKLSVDRSSVWSAEEAFRYHVDHRRKDNVGTWAISVDEVTGEGLGAFAESVPADPETGIPENPAHAYVHFRDLGRKEVEAVAQILKDAAITRGVRYAPPTNGLAVLG